MERTLPVVGVGRGPGSTGRGLTNIQDEEEKREYFDSEVELSRKLDRVAQWLRDSKYTIMFTGAGVSTRYTTHTKWPINSIIDNMPPCEASRK